MDRERYSDVWSQRTSLGNLTAEANEFLLISALHNGQPGFAYWMAQLPTEDLGKALEVVKSRLLNPDIEVSQAAQEAVHQAIIDGQLSDEQQRALKTLLWDAFDHKVAPTSDGATDTAADPRRVRRIAASQLWMLRKYTNATELARFGPVVARGWLAKHGRQLVLPVLAALVTTAIILAALALQERLKGDWTQITNLFAGPVAAAAIDSDDRGDVWAITPRGPQPGQVMTLLHRPANGSTWQVASESIMSDLDVRTTPPTVLLALGQRIYVGIYSRGILRSTDFGASWQLINRGLGSYDIRDLVADPNDPNTLYAASGDQRGVWRSIDGGDTWEGFSEGELFGASVLSLEWTMANDGALVAGTNDGRIAMRSPTDNAWQLVSAWPGAGEMRTLTAEPLRREIVYAGTSTGKVLGSDNGGLDWYLLADLREGDEGIFQVNTLVIAGDQTESVYLDGYGIGGNRLWKGTQGDQGFIWEPLAAEKFTREKVREMLFSASSSGRTMYAAGDAGMFESSDDGQTWSVSPGFNSPLASIGGLATSPVAGGLIYAVVQGAAFTSQNPEEGEWARGEGLLAQSVRAIAVDPIDPMTAYAGALLLNEWPLFVTSDGGKHWKRTSPPDGIPVALLNDISAVEAVAAGDGRTTIYAGTIGCGVLYWPDTREAWQTWGRQDCQVGNTAPSVVIDIAPAPDNPQYVVVAADTNKIYVSSDAGRQWELSQFTSTTEITDLAADPQLSGRFYLVTGTGGFWRSDDGGRNWKKLGAEFDDKTIGLLAVVPGTSGRLFVGSGTGEVWSSTNGGDSWKRVEGTATGFNVTALSSMTVDGSDGSLLVGSRNGLYRYQPGTLIPDR